MVIDWSRLIEERNGWVRTNFPGDKLTHSVFGVIEELGELTHCHLKEKQGIRGTAEEHRELAQDAIGDMTIYLLGVMKTEGFPSEPQHEYVAMNDLDHCLLLIAHTVGSLANSPSLVYVERIVDLLKKYCDLRGWDYSTIVYTTWDKVKKRDWQKDRIAGGEVCCSDPDPHQIGGGAGVKCLNCGATNLPKETLADVAD